MPTEVTESNLICLGQEQMTSITTSTKLPNIPRDAEYAELQATVQNVRLKLDGTAPTASVGMVLVVGMAGRTIYSALRDVRVIQETAGAVLEVAYYRNRRHDD